MERKRVAILGARGMVGQKFVQMLSEHPWFEISGLTSSTMAQQPYGEAVDWVLDGGVPTRASDLVLSHADPKELDADLVFSALPGGVARGIEKRFAEAGFPVVSNSSAFRLEPDVPLIVPEVNPQHLQLLDTQRGRRDWGSFIVTTPNCTSTILSIPLKALMGAYGLRKVVVVTMQAVSGAGYPGVPSYQIMDNVIPFIPQEEEKVRHEVSKMLGKFEGGSIRDPGIEISASCNRVPVLDGHLESVYVELDADVGAEEALKTMSEFSGLSQEEGLPTAPDKPILVSREEDRPQTRQDRLSGSVPGMSVVVGRVRPGGSRNSLLFSLLGHNTIRGAAGCAILLAELLLCKGHVVR